MVRVTHLSRDDVTGGAARCAYRLHHGLLRLGLDSTMRVARMRGADPGVVRWIADRRTSSKLSRRLVGRRIRRDRSRYRTTEPSDTELFSDDRAASGDGPLVGLDDQDVVNVHWVSSFVDYRALMRAARFGTPRFVWTLHDMNAFTGGCHYDRSCGRFVASCGSCPQLGSEREADLSRDVLMRKRQALEPVSRGDLHIVTPSRWLAREVERSSLLGGRFDVSVIPYGLDLDVLKPRPKGAARLALGLPADGQIVLFVAQSIDNPRKGFGLLAQALSGLETDSSLLLLSLGAGRPELSADVPYRQVGYTTDDHLLATVYSAADVFVTPTLQDNLPATVLEAMACGTAAVGFEVGGVPEMIRDGETGLLARAESVPALRSALAEALARPERLAEMGRQSRLVAEGEYSLQLQAERYRDLYRSLTESTESSEDR
jgi:glycosyltransferase involved in cell wall biosynthesis